MRERPAVLPPHDALGINEKGLRDLADTVVDGYLRLRIEKTMPTIVRLVASSANLLSSGASCRQGAHPVAQKFRITGRPREDLSSNGRRSGEGYFRSLSGSVPSRVSAERE